MRVIGMIIFGILLACFGWGWALFIFLVMILPFALPLFFLGMLIEWLDGEHGKRRPRQ